MPLQLPKPTICLITSGKSTVRTEPASKEFSRILQLAEAAVGARVDLLQLREKNLHAGVLYKLARQVAMLAQGSVTRVLVNDRADIARAAGADGVHLTTASLEASVIRRTFGPEFLIGVSTHSAEDVRAARRQGADFVVFGPVFETESKRAYGKPLGLEMVKKVTAELESFPVLAIGGVTIEHLASCFRAGATGIAAIRLLDDHAHLIGVVDQIRSKFAEGRK